MVLEFTTQASSYKIDIIQRLSSVSMVDGTLPLVLADPCLPQII